jgi:tRNA (cytosine38-C5)-methyltransferase
MDPFNMKMETGRSIRMIEFFSGMGGMRYALECALGESSSRLAAVRRKTPPAATAAATAAATKLSACWAFEISEKANAVYRHNFPNEQQPGSFGVRTKLVEQLTVQDLPQNSNLWTMSPPCQPFTNTRMAKQRDLDDKRTAGFLASLNLLRLLEASHRPRWILLENVGGFVGSAAQQLLYETLRDCDYSWQDGLLSPFDLGIPNHRNRYYMLCEQSDRFFQRGHETPGQSSEETPLSLQSPLLQQHQVESLARHSLSRYLDTDDETKNIDALGIPESVFAMDWAKYLPVVSHLDTQSHCFTAAYGRQLHRATGSLLLMEPTRQQSVQESSIDRHDMMQYSGKLRRFSPSELLRLFGFPETFHFPAQVDLGYQYKLIGNSISVFVVKELMKRLLRL